MTQVTAISNPDADGTGRGTLRVNTSWFWRLTVSPFLFALGVFCSIVFLREWAHFQLFAQILIPSTAIVMIVISVDYFQRVLLFCPDRVRVRVLWVWRTIMLPPQIILRVSPLGEIILSESVTGRRCFRVGRDFTRSGRLTSELEAYYRRWRRIGDPVV